MDLRVKLITAGSLTGPTFDLYSDIDNYTTPFAQGISKEVLLQPDGQIFATVPDGITKIKIVNTEGDCPDLIVDVTIWTPPTTTTTSTPVDGTPPPSDTEEPISCDFEATFTELLI